jgi:ubiquinol-cytochrome c reductase subunit 6
MRATECANSKQCAPHKHHYEECVERVTKQQEENDGKADEDCVEECTRIHISI